MRDPNARNKKISILFAIIFVINFSCFVYLIFIRKTHTQVTPIVSQYSADLISEHNFYNMPCPDVSFSDINGTHWDLNAWAGNVILLKFSRFFLSDLPELIYLDGFARQLEENGVRIVFINSRGKYEVDLVNDHAHFRAPIVEDNGNIAAIFNAFPTDLIIIDRDFSIKYKHQSFNKYVIYKEVLKWTFNDNAVMPYFGNICELLLNCEYINVHHNKVVFLKDVLNGHKGIVMLVTSLCFTCEEMSRLQLVKEYATASNDIVVLLFSSANTLKAVSNYASIHDLNQKNIVVGVINSDKDVSFLGGTCMLHQWCIQSWDMYCVDGWVKQNECDVQTTDCMMAGK